MQEFEYGRGLSGEVSGKPGGIESTYFPWLDRVAPRHHVQPGNGVPRGGEFSGLGSAGTAREDLSLSALVHDTRNMVTAMELYCDLLDEPEVLAAPYRRYAGELRLVAVASRRLMDRLSRAGLSLAGTGPVGSAASVGVGAMAAGEEAPKPPPAPGSGQHLVSAAGDGHGPGSAPMTLARPGRMQAFAVGEPIVSLAEDLRANQNLLSAVAGRGVTVGLELRGGDRPLPMTREDLTRVLVNLTKNAAEAMPGGGHLQIDLEESAESLSMTFTDGGPGISPEAIETIFTPGYTTRVNVEAEQAGQAPVVAWPLPHRGLGLAIVRSIVAAAGGAAWAANRRDGCGAVLVLEFPLCAACPEVGLASES